LEVSNTKGGILEVDIADVFAKYNDTMKSLHVAVCNIVASECLPYRGGLKQLNLADVTISDSGRKWFAESGVFESPALTDLRLDFDDVDTATFVVSRVKLPYLSYLQISGQGFDSEASVRELVLLFNRTPSMIRISFYGIFKPNPAFIVGNLRTLPALLQVNITLCDEFANLVWQWALSDENVSVWRIVVRQYTELKDVSPNDFFLHPCVMQIEHWGSPALEHKLNSMQTAKRCVVHFGAFVRNNKAMERLPDELTMEVFEMYRRWRR
jgi:hypothetical protein